MLDCAPANAPTLYLVPAYFVAWMLIALTTLKATVGKGDSRVLDNKSQC